MSTRDTEQAGPGRNRLRLSRAQRLRGRSAVASMFRLARRVGGGELALLFRANGLERNRFLVSARQGFAGAVERNRERRRIREIYRQMGPRLRGGYDLAAIVGPPPRSYQQRSLQLEALLRSAGVLLS